VALGKELLGKVLDASGKTARELKSVPKEEVRRIDVKPRGLEGRASVNTPFETGYAIVDMLVPLGVGQRELVIGDKQTGKTSFLQGVMQYQAARGTICIYALIGKRNIDLASLVEYCKITGIAEKCIIIYSTASDSAGMIFLTPYTAMTIAEYFRDLGHEVLLILDDLTTHAQYYREISLQAKRFPGRSSYPGDIFYIHSKLLERAGSFEKGKITCLPAAETVAGDLSGYIQTNLMAITDGHIFFDIEAFNQGRRPAVNPYLSVTRVGQQAQSQLLRDVSHQLSSFLFRYESLRDLSHFGSEFEERVSKDLRLGERIFIFFNQTTGFLIPINISILLIAALWSGYWVNEIDEKITTEVKRITLAYFEIETFRTMCDQVIAGSQTFESVVNTLKDNQNFFHV
jgi:F-type H+-transporting ATPase subunit alpha